MSWLLAWGPAGLVAAVVTGLLLFEPGDRLTTFATVFLGIVFEALPFLLAGVLVSSALQTYVPSALVQRFVPAGRLRGALAGALLGAIFPVCECGVVPVARRLLGKGVSLPAALGFLLAGPVVNPVVFAATWTALGPEMATLRLTSSLAIAVLVAWLYGLHPEPALVLRPPRAGAGGTTTCDFTGDGHSVGARLNVPMRSSSTTVPPGGSSATRFASTLVAAGDELLEMGRYLVLGAAAAALLRTLLPGPTLVELGQGPVLSVGLMMLLAALLSICSVVDAFVALSLSGLVSTGAMLAFLIFGPVVDIKSIVLYGALFRWQTVGMIVLLLAQLVLLIGVAINLNVG
jgi:uncharacterized membrane protein YraQ (UPF0718 family)